MKFLGFYSWCFFYQLIFSKMTNFCIVSILFEIYKDEEKNIYIQPMEIRKIQYDSHNGSELNYLLGFYLD